MKQYKSNIDQIGLKRISSNIKKVKIVQSKDAAEYAKQFYFDDITIYESAFMILLNQQNNTVGWVKLSVGGVAQTIMDVKLVAKYALESLARSVILVHNHPSGNRNPSEADKKITVKIGQGLKLLDIELLDHIILTEDSYTSLADEGFIG